MEARQRNRRVLRLFLRAARSDPGVAVFAGQEIEDGVISAASIAFSSRTVDKRFPLASQVEFGDRWGPSRHKVIDQGVLEDQLFRLAPTLYLRRKYLDRTPFLMVWMAKLVLT